MLRQFFIINSVLIILTMYTFASGSALIEKAEKSPVIITSSTLTADNKHNTATFEGSVIAKTGDITINSDKMTVYYDNSESRIKKIHATGNVKVYNKDRALFSNEATYYDNEEKIIFVGNPKAVEGENLITGTQIIFFLNEDRAVVEGSRVILQNRQDVK